VIELISGAITRRQDRFLNEREGYLEREDDLLYCTLIDRCSKWITNGFVSGLGQFEALAATLSTSLNLLVVGQDISAMARAALRVVEMGGGIALIEKGGISYSFPLKLAGVMSDQSFTEAAAKIQEFEEKVSALGYKYNDICYTLLFLACDFLPFLRITALGIIDIKNKRTIIPSRRIKINPGE
ncbi:MAG: Adenine deaminase, partial [Desulfotomaculum sp. 46_296]